GRRLKIRRAVHMRYAKVPKIFRNACSIIECKLLVQLQTIGRAGNTQTLPSKETVMARFGSLCLELLRADWVVPTSQQESVAVWIPKDAICPRSRSRRAAKQCASMPAENFLEAASEQGHILLTKDPHHYVI